MSSKPPLVLFPSDSLDPRAVDAAFAEERAAAERAGLATALLDAEALDAGAVDRAVRRVPEGAGEALLRGWMLRVEAYAALHDALARRGVALLNDPQQYRHAHHLPASYEVIRAHTPRTVWTSGPTFDPAMLAPFGEAPLIVKDYVKSQKHDWSEACFIPSARDEAAVRRVVDWFLALQGDSFTGGLVFRELVELEPLARHPVSGMPLTREWRIFWLDGAPLAAAEYWSEGDYAGARPPEGLFAGVAARVRSRFFTMDVARRTTGEWIILELGDGQVAGLPDRLPPDRFYAALAAARRG